MNIIFDGTVVFSLKIKEVSCYYFCKHFSKTFKTRKDSEKQIFFLRDMQKN